MFGIFRRDLNNFLSRLEIHAILKETLGEYTPSFATVKYWVSQFEHGDFSTCFVLRPGQSNK
jgi:hypothetical protein